MQCSGAWRAYTATVHANKLKLWIASLSLLLLFSSGALPAAGTRGNMTVDDVRSPATPPGSTVGVVYLVIVNRGDSADQLTGVETPAAAAAGLHQTLVVDGLQQMRAVETLECPPGATVKVEPGGLHIMLGGLRSPLTAGMRFPLILRFRHAGDLSVEVVVN